MPPAKVYEICLKTTAKNHQNRQNLPCGKPITEPGFPQVFPTLFPHPVEKSVDFSVKMWKNPRLPRLFWCFTRVKSGYGVVDKSRLVIFEFPTDCGKFIWKYAQKKERKAERMLCLGMGILYHWSVITTCRSAAQSRRIHLPPSASTHDRRPGKQSRPLAGASHLTCGPASNTTPPDTHAF